MRRKNKELQKYRRQNEDLKRKRVEGGERANGPMKKRAKLSDSLEDDFSEGVNWLSVRKGFCIFFEHLFIQRNFFIHFFFSTKVAKIFRAVAGLPEGSGPDWEDPEFWLQFDVGSQNFFPLPSPFPCSSPLSFFFFFFFLAQIGPLFKESTAKDIMEHRNKEVEALAKTMV